MVAGVGFGKSDRELGLKGGRLWQLGIVGFRDSGDAWLGASVDPLGGGLDPSSIKDSVPKDYAVIPRCFGDDSAQGLVLKYSDATEE